MLREKIKWDAKTHDVLFNPRIPIHEKNLLDQTLGALQPLNKGTFIFGTSGSTGSVKWVVLSKEAVLNSAKAVNTHLDCSHSDCWLNPLPPFHVGGMGIYARAFLSGAQVLEISQPKWNPEAFVTQLKETRATLTALVPTQVFDLVSGSYTAPASLRAVIVGGGVLSEKLYFEAINSGWRLLPSYGLTECASQVATAEIGSWEKGEFPALKPLEHVQIDLNGTGRLKIKSSALFEGYLSLEENKLIHSKEAGWFTTEDFGSIDKGRLLKVWRDGTFLKIGGESVDMARLDSIFEEVMLSLNSPFDGTLISVPDHRLGSAIHLVVCQRGTKESIDQLLEMMHCRVFPYERVRQVHVVSEIPRSPLQKVLKEEILNLIGF